MTGAIGTIRSPDGTICAVTRYRMLSDLRSILDVGAQPRALSSDGPLGDAFGRQVAIAKLAFPGARHWPVLLGARTSSSRRPGISYPPREQLMPPCVQVNPSALTVAVEREQVAQEQGRGALAALHGRELLDAAEVVRAHTALALATFIDDTVLSPLGLRDEVDVMVAAACDRASGGSAMGFDAELVVAAARRSPNAGLLPELHDRRLVGAVAALSPLVLPTWDRPARAVGSLRPPEGERAHRFAASARRLALATYLFAPTSLDRPFATAFQDLAAEVANDATKQRMLADHLSQHLVAVRREGPPDVWALYRAGLTDVEPDLSLHAVVPAAPGRSVRRSRDGVGRAEVAPEAASSQAAPPSLAQTKRLRLVRPQQRDHQRPPGGRSI